MSIRKLKARGIGRFELLSWLNEFLETDYTKIEHLADGIAYCQIFDALYPGKVLLHQVNFEAKREAEFEKNIMVLKKAFQACDIRKEIPVRKLTQGVFQEHFEFLHWIHDHVHRTYPDAVINYSGFERRKQVLGDSLSLSELNSTNTNLVPKFLISPKILKKSYIESLTKEDLMDQGGSVKCEPTQKPEEIIEIIPATPELIKHSYEHTNNSHRLIVEIEKQWQLMSDTSKRTEKNRAFTSARDQIERHRSLTKSGSQKSSDAKTGKVNSNTHISNILENIQILTQSLELELEGRVNDIETLETSIKSIEVQRDNLFELLGQVEKKMLSVQCEEKLSLIQLQTMKEIEDTLFQND